jgi:TIR domain-containing protein
MTRVDIWPSEEQLSMSDQTGSDAIQSGRPAPESPPVFISYARADGRAEATRLVHALTDRHISAWMDESSIDPYQDFSVDIEKAIARASHVVVCLTPTLAGARSFVLNEIICAQNKGKPIIPLLLPAFPRNAVPILINNLIWIDFSDFDTGFAELVARLRAPISLALAPSLREDSHRAAVERLRAFVVQKLRQTVFELRDLLQLHGTEAPTAVKHQYESRRIAWFGADESLGDPPRYFASVTDALVEYQGRLLLLGEPGSGKTTAGWALLHEKSNERLADPAALLPIYAEITSWDGKSDLASWLGDEAGIDPRELAREMANGRALLVLDGLDELPDSVVDAADPARPRRDYRVAFLELLSQAPRTPTVVTCW